MGVFRGIDVIDLISADPIPCDCDLAWLIRDNVEFFPRVFGNCLVPDGNKTWFNNDDQVAALTDAMETC